MPVASQVSCHQLCKHHPYAATAAAYSQAHLGLKGQVNGTGHMFQSAREKVIEQAHKDGGVVSRQLAQVEVAQRAQQHLVLCNGHGCMLGKELLLFGCGSRFYIAAFMCARALLLACELGGSTLHAAGYVQRGLDGAQLPVIVARLPVCNAG